LSRIGENQNLNVKNF